MSKYKNIRTVVDGISFASKAEATRYGELKLLERAGEICDLKIQPIFRLQINGYKICNYIGDFSYLYKKGNFQVIVEDVKSQITARLPVYRLKKKLMAAIHGIEIVEISK